MGIDDKRRHWAMIKDKSPDMAEFMLLLSSEFGKLGGMSVEFNVGDAINTIVPDPKLWDGRVRLMRNKNAY